MTDLMHNVEILPVTTTTDIVSITHPSMTENNINGRAVICDIEPVTHVRTVAIDGDGLSQQTRTDHRGDKFLLVLIGAVIIGAVRRHCWQAIGLVVCSDQMVRRRFTRRVGRVGCIRRGFAKRRIMGSKRAVDLIRGDMVKTTSLRIPCLVLEPENPGRLQQREGAHDVGLDERRRPRDGPVHVGLRGAMYNGINLILS
jgi:hypothetical protein